MSADEHTPACMQLPKVGLELATATAVVADQNEDDCWMHLDCSLLNWVSSVYSNKSLEATSPICQKKVEPATRAESLRHKPQTQSTGAVDEWDAGVGLCVAPGCAERKSFPGNFVASVCAGCQLALAEHKSVILLRCTRVGRETQTDENIIRNKGCDLQHVRSKLSEANDANPRVAHWYHEREYGPVVRNSPATRYTRVDPRLTDNVQNPCKRESR